MTPPDTDDLAVVAEAVRLRGAGEGYRAIAKAIGRSRHWVRHRLIQAALANGTPWDSVPTNPAVPISGQIESRTAAEYVERITACWRGSVEAIIEAGRLLSAAKATLVHGEFLAMIEQQLPFGASTAQRLMAIAADRRLAIAAHGQHLPPHWRTLYELTKLDDEQFQVRIGDGTISPDMERADIAQKIKRERRDARERELAAKTDAGNLALPAATYGVIVADPQWGRTVYSKETGMDRHAANHYRVALGDQATQDDSIKALPVASIAASDCVLGLWCTDPHRGVDVMRAWGFEPRSYFVWIKDIIEVEVPAASRAALGLGPGRMFQAIGAPGTGFWNRDRDELMLIGVRGHPVCPAPGTQGESVWFARRGEHAACRTNSHSDKPDCALEWFERHWPHTPKIELNARRARAGWRSWGLEAPTAPSTLLGAERSEIVSPLSISRRRRTGKRGQVEVILAAAPPQLSAKILNPLKR